MEDLVVVLFDVARAVVLLERRLVAVRASFINDWMESSTDWTDCTADHCSPECSARHVPRMERQTLPVALQIGVEPHLSTRCRCDHHHGGLVWIVGWKLHVKVEEPQGVRRGRGTDCAHDSRGARVREDANVSFTRPQLMKIHHVWKALDSIRVRAYGS